MTMRQVSGLLKVINKSELVQFYNSLSAYGIIHGAKLPTQTEFLNSCLNKSTEASPQFDEATDKTFEAQALKRLEERRKLG